MKIKSHSLLFISSIVGLVVVVGLFVFGMRLINVSTIETSAILGKIDQVTKKNAELNTIKKTITATEEDRAKLAAYFVTDQSIVSFLEYLESLGTLTNTDTSIITVSEDKESSTATITLSSIGSYSDTIRFIELLENMPYRMEIERFTFVTKEDPADDTEEITNPKWQVDITFRLISYRNS